MIVKPCTRQEIEFYESASAHPEFEAFMPTFMGMLALANETEVAQQKPDVPSQKHGKKVKTGESIVLENVTGGFRKPNVMDIKLGAQLWDESASQEKRDRLDKVAAATTSSSLGFRIAGMKVWKGKGPPLDEHGYSVFDKLYGRTFTAETVIEAFETFLNGRKELAAAFGADIEALQQVLEREESRMYSSSILLVYEGDPAGEEPVLKVDDDETDEDSESDDGPKTHSTHLIDFAHAKWTPGEGADENVLQGVRSVCTILKRL
jgi:1D-myo-inositol-tetrakisphosphate 5-kinase/inositol-polyphosphate multikinase